MKKTRCESGKARVLPTGEDATVAQLAHALAHPARVAIVRLLKEREACLCGDIVEVLPLAQSTVSQHLKVLKDSGWIQGEIDGPRVCYCLNPLTLEKFKDVIEAL